MTSLLSIQHLLNSFVEIKSLFLLDSRCFDVGT
jgi:hypothetical protein